MVALSHLCRTSSSCCHTGVRVLVACSLLAVILPAGRAQSLSVPNASSESPSTGFVNTNIDSWQKEPQSASFQQTSGYTWSQLAGVFANTAPGKSDHITNLDGNQAAYLFAISEAGISQDYNTTDWQNLPPTHAFNVVFELGKSYAFTVGINGGGGNMLPGATLLLAVYYRDAGGNRVTVASTTVVYSAAMFPNHTALVDFQVNVPVVKPGDAWLGQQMGILIYSSVTPALQGGYWDLDNVRLTAAAGSPFPVAISRGNNSVNLSWPSVSGYEYQVQTSADLQTWLPYQSPIDGTGNPLAVNYSTTGLASAFFRVQVTQATQSGNALPQSARNFLEAGPTAHRPVKVIRRNRR